MCYHKSLNVKGSELEERYEANLPEASAFQPVYHANAYQFPDWPILTHQQPDQFQYMRWGLVPHWTKTSDNAAEIRTRTLNARSESVYEKPSFRSAAQTGKRCLIPVTGFYEWHTMGSKKFPFYINSTAQKIVSIAGLWDEWADPETGELIHTYTLLTTDANPLLAAIHNSKKRMPCLLSEKDEQIWLHDELNERDALALLNKQYPVSKLHSYSISKRITSRSEPSDVPEVLTPSTYPELTKHPELFAA
ncbi:SOS response-associated peptidase [Spirosoma panaciterrae]|uniref:SOS response-associated peptidase n=1 Tax=Spirosoma panaciterrae TaxID=496058 RepID=UPI00037E5EF0|nr:SOS response-associated peptidase [Spirosoma panaciterrae]